MVQSSTKPCHITTNIKMFGDSNCVRNKEAYHLQQSQIAGTYVVKIDLDVFPAHPRDVGVDELVALCLVVHFVGGKVFLRRFVKAVVILPREQVDTHDTENQPKDEANQQHIHNGRDGTHQGVDYNLEREWNRQCSAA